MPTAVEGLLALALRLNAASVSAALATNNEVTKACGPRP